MLQVVGGVMKFHEKVETNYMFSDVLDQRNRNFRPENCFF